jgi:hypothetical protein
MRLTETDQLILDAIACGARLDPIQGSTMYKLSGGSPVGGFGRNCQRGTIENLISMGLIEDPPSNGLTVLGMQRANPDRFRDG